jgi:large subunit ribosomal protein L1
MSKRMKDLKSKVDANKLYALDEALALVKSTSTVKFDASVEVHVRLGIDVAKSDQQIRATVALPHGTGKKTIIAAFVGPNDEKAAKDAGADFVYTEADVKGFQSGATKIEFDIAVSTPEMMPKLASAARILGPKGLMPNPKTGTVDKDVARMVTELKKGKVAFKNDDTGNIHTSIGKVSFDAEKLKANYESLLEALKKAKPSSSKGTYLKAVYLTSSMGPSIKVEVAQ